MLRVIPARHLLCLPGQMIQVGMEIFQINAQEIVPGRISPGQIAPGKVFRIREHFLHRLLQECKPLPKLLIRLVQLLDIKRMDLLIIQNTSQVFKQQLTIILFHLLPLLFRFHTEPAYTIPCRPAINLHGRILFSRIRG